MLRIRTPWDSQPQDSVDLVDWLPAGTLAYVGSQRRLIGARSVYAESGTVSYNPGKGGIGARSGTTSSYINAGLISQALVGATWAFQFRKLDSTVRWISGTTDTGTNYLEQIAINANNSLTTSADRLAISLRADAGSPLSAQTGAVLVTGEVHTAVITLSSSTSYRIWIDGIEQSLTYGGTAAAGTTSGIADFPLALVNNNNRNAFTGGTNVDLLCYARIPGQLPDPWFVSRDIWQLFAPRSIWVPVSVGGGSASTITAAAGASTASTLAASSTAASTPTAAAGAATASTVAASSTAASAITSATGAATASTLTGSAVVAGGITAAAGMGTGGTLVGDTLAAGSAAIVAADGVATTATLGGSSVAAAAIGVAAGAATTSVMGGPGAAAQITGGGWFPMPRRRTKKELDDERRRLGILPPEVVEEVAAAPVARRRITLQDLIGKKAAAEITNVDLSQAIAASKKRKRQRDDELLLLM